MIDLGERETIERVKSRQGFLSKIQDVLLFGKGTREDLKDLDKQLREDYYSNLLDLRHKWEEVYLQTIEAKQTSLGRKFKTVIQSCDRVMEQINRASYGYAPLMNRLGQIEETELARVFNYDREIGEYLDRLREGADRVSKNVVAEDWETVSDSVDDVKGMLDEIERKWKDREKSFRSTEM